MNHPALQLDADDGWDLGPSTAERPVNPPESDLTEREQLAREAAARATVEREADELNYWLGVFDDSVLPLDLATIGRELHKAWRGGSVRHPLRDVALDHVDRMVVEELAEMARDN